MQHRIKFKKCLKQIKNYRKDKPQFYSNYDFYNYYFNL